MLARIANVILALIGILVLGLLLYTLIRPDGYSDNLTQGVVTYGALGLLLLVVLSAVWMSPMARVRLVFVLFSFGFGAYFAEVVVTMLGSDPLAIKVYEAKQAGRHFDPRSKVEVIESLRAEGVPAVGSISPPRLRVSDDQGVFRSAIELDGKEVFPLAGISRRPTVLCNELGEYATFDSDEHGFNNPLGIWPRGRVEVMGVGDSLVLGHCVAADQNAMARIREAVPSTLNLGMSGNSALYTLASLIEYGGLIRPRTVLWFYNQSDVAHFEIGHDAKTPLLMRYLEPGFEQQLAARQEQIDRALLEWLEEKMKTSESLGIPARLEQNRPSAFERLRSILVLRSTRALLVGLVGHRDEPWERETTLLPRILERARDAVQAWGGTLYVVYAPLVTEVGAGEGMLTGRNEPREEILEVIRELDVPLIDLLEPLDAHPDPKSLYSYRGPSPIAIPHWTPDGYARVATHILDALGDLGAIEPR